MAVLLALACAFLLVSVAPALAAYERGHTFGFQFGEPGSGAGQFEEPVAVAVDEATGEVYVADRKAKHVDRFQCPITTAELEASPSCTYLSQFATGSVLAIAVDNSTTNKSLDPSAGDVYTASGHKVLKFTAAGTLIGEITEFAPGETLESGEKLIGVAVDASGNLWAEYNEEGEEAYIATFNDAEPNALTQEAVEYEEMEYSQPGLAIDSRQHAYLVYEPEGAVKKHCGKETCFVGKFQTPQSFLLEQRELEEALGEEEEPEVEEGQPLLPAMDHRNSTGVAVDVPGGDEVYVDEETGVAALTSAGGLVQRFGAGHLEEGAGLAIDSVSKALYVADAHQANVQVFVPTPPHEPVVVTEGVSHLDPSTGSVRLEAQINPFGADTKYRFEYGTSTAYGQTAPVPDGDVGSSFEAQNATAAVSGLETGTVYHYRVVAENGLGAGAIVGPDRTFRLLVSSSEAGLLDGREWEMVSPASKFGASVLPVSSENTNPGVMRSSAAGGAISYSADAPTERGPEGNRAPERTQVFSVRGSEGWSSADITTPDNVKGGFSAGGEPPEYRLFSEDLALGVVVPFRLNSEEPLAEPPLTPPVLPAEQQEKTIYLRQDAPVQPEEAAAAAEVAAYDAAMRNGEVEGKSAGFLALLTAANVPGGTHFGGTTKAQPNVEFLGASPDLTHAMLISQVALTSPGGPGLYEWSAGMPVSQQLQQVSILPGGAESKAPPVSAFLRLGAGFSARNAISSDGSRVVWEEGDEGKQGTRLFVRDLVKKETVELGQPIVGSPQAANTGPVFQIASTDGSKIFFTDEQKLVAGSGAGLGRPELYVCELAEKEGKLACRVTDLSEGKAHDGESGDVQGAVLGISGEGCDAGSSEGCDVYFVANGALTEDATTGECNELEPRPGRTCNLYMRRYSEGKWQAPVLVAALANADQPDWLSNQTGPRVKYNLGHITSRVSSNGRFLAFMSKRELTPYDNTDLSSGARDEEVYLYNASTSQLICASCNPDGSRPTGVLDTPQAAEKAGEGQSPLVDRAELWSTEGERVGEPIYLAGNIPGWTPVTGTSALQQSRYLSDNGRLFFNAAGGLVPQDKNGKEDVYEYEPVGMGNCTSVSATFSEGAGGCVALISSGKSKRESAFFEASKSGGDVFFLTAEQLSTADQDTNYDLYDAHECTEASPCPPPLKEKGAPCASEAECKAAYEPGGASASPGTSTFSGPGNSVARVGVLSVTSSKPKPLTRAQKLAKALKQCRKAHKHSKKKRTACERRARKRYGPAKLAAALKRCDKRHKHSRRKRLACERSAMKRYAREHRRSKSASHRARAKGGR